MKTLFLASIIGALASGCAAQAGNLIQNGGFETTQGGVYGTATSVGLAADGAFSLWAPDGGNTDSSVADWTYSWGSIGAVFTQNALTAGDYPNYGGGQNYDAAYLQFTNLGTDPNGGNFVGLDGDHWGGALSQTIDGLTVGGEYTLTFYQATDHYQGWGDAQSSTIVASLGGQSFAAPTLSTTAGGVNWSKVTTTFTATSASELLSFTNQGTGAPPFALLDGVSLTSAAPEPATWAMMMVGLGALGGLARRRRSQGAVAALAEA